MWNISELRLPSNLISPRNGAISAPVRNPLMIFETNDRQSTADHIGPSYVDGEQPLWTG